MSGRSKPYTSAGVQRLNCCVKGCDRKACASKQVDASDNTYEPFCIDHMLQINEFILRLICGGDARIVSEKLNRYEDQLTHESIRQRQKRLLHLVQKGK